MELKITEPNAPAPKSILKKNTITYDDILAKMGMYVHDGKLHLGNKTQEQSCNTTVKMECSKVKCGKLQESIKKVAISLPPPHQNQEPNQNSYIYNKYFKNQLPKETSEIISPKTPEEFNNLLKQKIIEKRLQRLRLSQVKSSKLIMPTDNIQVAKNHQNENKLFGFSQGL